MHREYLIPNLQPGTKTFIATLSILLFETGFNLTLQNLWFCYVSFSREEIEDESVNPQVEHPTATVFSDNLESGAAGISISQQQMSDSK